MQIEPWQINSFLVAMHHIAVALGGIATSLALIGFVNVFRK